MPRVLAALLAAATASAAPWKFEDAYPVHYVARRLRGGERITVDGALDDAAWGEVPWTEGLFEDIAAPMYADRGIPPPAFQTRVKVRWDAAFLYVAAELRDPLVWGNVTGHNEDLTAHHAPYFNNDFEVFVDVSGSTHWYKEFEMSVRNATYDVLWRVPGKGLNSLGVPCDDHSTSVYCQNSSYNIADKSLAPQTWTMYGGASGLRTGTAYSSAGYEPFEDGKWTAEIAFPIRGQTGVHGGLLDTDGGRDAKYDYARYDPNTSGRWWWIDFARAQHPLKGVGSSPLAVDFTSPEYSAFCAEVQKQHPSLLGVTQYDCYWEFVWQNVGYTKYMHNPEMWGVVQFAGADGGTACKIPTWPARYIGLMLHRAQIRYFIQSGVYARDAGALLRGGACKVEYDCNATAVEAALSGPESAAFQIALSIDDASSTACPDYAAWTPTGAPCFSVVVTTVDPVTNATHTVTVDADRHVSETGVAGGSCL